METVDSMIPVYILERLTIEDIDRMVEKGVVFDVRSEASLLSEGNSSSERDAFWSSRSDDAGNI